MNWKFLVSPDENTMHEHRVEMLLRDVNMFLISTFLGYLICALRYVPLFSTVEHVILAITLSGYFAYVLILFSDKNKFRENSYKKYGY